MTIADRLAVFMDGRIVQIGTPAQVFASPSTVSVAGFIGSPPMNLLQGRVAGGVVHIGDTELPGVQSASPDGPVIVGVRPSAVRLRDAGLPARIELVEDLGDAAIVDLAMGETIVKMRTDRRPVAQEGDAVHIAFERSAVHLFDAASGERV